MVLETEQMQDEVLEMRTRAAISHNKLVRLDNPIVANKIRTLSQQAEQALAEMQTSAVEDGMMQLG